MYSSEDRRVSFLVQAVHLYLVSTICSIPFHASSMYINFLANLTKVDEIY